MNKHRVQRPSVRDDAPDSDEWPWGRGLVGIVATLVAGAASCAMTIGYWAARDEPILATYAAVCEMLSLVALGFLVRAWSRGAWFQALIAGLFLVGSIVFCGSTNSRALEAQAAQRVERALQNDPAHQRALAALDSASAAIAVEQARAPPSCACPETIRARHDAQQQMLALLNAQRDKAAQELAQTTPPVTSLEHQVLAGFVEIVKIGGLFVFAPSRTSSRGEPVRRRMGGGASFGLLRWVFAFLAWCLLTLGQLVRPSRSKPVAAMATKCMEGGLPGGAEGEASGPSMSDAAPDAIAKSSMSDGAPTTPSGSNMSGILREAVVGSNMSGVSRGESDMSGRRVASGSDMSDVASGRVPKSDGASRAYAILHQSGDPRTPHMSAGSALATPRLLAAAVPLPPEPGAALSRRTTPTNVSPSGAGGKGGVRSRELRRARIARVQAMARAGIAKVRIAMAENIARSTVYADLHTPVE